MKKLIYIPILAGLILLTYSCVEDYQDANPPRLLDAPAVNSITISDDLIEDGTSTEITVNVVDAPAGVDSVGVSAVDENDDPAGSYTIDSNYSGITKGEITISYEAPEQFAGVVTITVAVYDKQFDEKGEVVRKNSVPKSVEVTVFCEPPLVGTYTVVGHFLVDDFSTPDVTMDQNVISVDCAYTYRIEDISGGLYTTSYADNYGTSARKADIHIDPDTNLVTWDPVSDQFGGQFVQDSSQPDSYYSPDSTKVVIYWTATAYGERGITTLTKQ